MSATHDLLVIGAGITGLHAARHAAAAGLKVMIVESLLYGGLVTNVNELDGAFEGSGVDLAATLMQEAKKAGAGYATDGVQSIARDGDAFAVRGDSGAYRAKAVVIASGAKLRKLGVPGEDDFEGAGVSSCADCDGPFYDGLEVVVVGGGDSAVQEAAVLAEYAKHVHVVHRGAAFRAKGHLVAALSEKANVTLHWNARVEEIYGESAVEGVRLKEGSAVRELPCAGFFAYVGLEPNGAFAPTEVARDATGALVTDASLQTAVPGLFAAGAVRAGYSGLLKDAAAEGIAAATAAMAALRAG